MSKFRNYDKYEVFENGRIWSYSHKKWLKPWTNKGGYQIVGLTDNEGKRKYYQVHRIVYETFSGSPIPKNLQCNHIDEDKKNCSFANINLLTPKENSNWGTRNKRMSKSLTNGKLSKQVGAYKNGELVMTFPSTAECGRQGFDFSAVARCCRGKLPHYKGFTWKYI